MTYTYGGTIEKVDGGKATAAFNDEPMKNALTTLQQMRWADNAMGSNFLFNQKQLQQEFAGGKVGMYIGTPGDYRDQVSTMGGKGQDIGVAPLPLDSPDGGTLTGGAVQMFNPKASKEQVAAAVKWAEFYWLEKFTDSEHAITDAKTANADKQHSVGLPMLWSFDDALAAAVQRVDQAVREHDPGELHAVHHEGGVAEADDRAAGGRAEGVRQPRPVVQTVLTKKDTDIGKLLGDASKTVDGLLANP